MLRITVHIDETGPTLQLEGRLAGQAILEAERCWRPRARNIQIGHFVLICEP